MAFITAFGALLGAVLLSLTHHAGAQTLTSQSIGGEIEHPRSVSTPCTTIGDMALSKVTADILSLVAALQYCTHCPSTASQAAQQHWAQHVVTRLGSSISEVLHSHC